MSRSGPALGQGGIGPFWDAIPKRTTDARVRGYRTLRTSTRQTDLYTYITPPRAYNKPLIYYLPSSITSAPTPYLPPRKIDDETSREELAAQPIPFSPHSRAIGPWLMVLYSLTGAPRYRTWPERSYILVAIIGSLWL